MAAADEIAVKLGLNATEFKAALKSAGAEVQTFAENGKSGSEKVTDGFRGMRREFQNLRLLFTAGGGAAILGFFDSLAERANKSKDSIDQNIDSTRRWGEDWKEIKDTVMDFGVQVLGLFARTGRAIADFFMAVEAGKKSLWSGDGFIAGFKKAREEIEAGNKAEEETRRGLQETIHRIEQVNKTRGAITKAAKDQAKEERDILQALKEQYAEDRKVEEGMARIAEMDHEAALDKMSDEEKIAQLLKDKLAIQAKIAAFEQFIREGGKLTSDGVETLLGLKNKQVDIEKAIAAATDHKVKSEKKVTEELKQQLGLLAGIRGGKQFNDASEETLKEIARRNRSEAQRIQSGSGGFGIGQDLETARLISEAQNAEKELAFRRNFRQTVDVLGESGARARFAGDPLQFDRVLQQLTGTQDKSTTLLQSLDDRLQTAGFGRR